MKHVLSAALILSLFAGGAAMAEPPDPRDDPQDSRHDDPQGNRRDDPQDNRHREATSPPDRQDERHDDRNEHHDDRADHQSRDDHRSDARGRYRVVEYHRPKGYREHKWHKGERLPTAYRAKGYVVEDYPAYRLRSPPRGYHWVRVNNDVVLVAIATGVVLEVMNDQFYQ